MLRGHVVIAALLPGSHQALAEIIVKAEKAGPTNGRRKSASSTTGASLVEHDLIEGATYEDALAALLRWLETRFRDQRLIAAGHRVVHGGSLYTAPVRIDASVIAELRRLIPLAPLHQPHHLAAIAALSKLYPALPQIACFDTAFHHTQPEVAAAFALPRQLTDEGIRRYGFHGLSYEYIASVLPDILGPAEADGRVVVAHLGSGASMCAMHRRKSVATIMGFTALDGLPMSRRCGNLDPGVVLYLMQEKGMTAAAVSDLLYNESPGFSVSPVSAMTCGLCWRARTRTRPMPLPCLSTVSAGSWDRSPPLSVGWTRWSSPPASASTPLKSGAACVRKPHGSV